MRPVAPTRYRATSVEVSTLRCLRLKRITIIQATSQAAAVNNRGVRPKKTSPRLVSFAQRLLVIRSDLTQAPEHHEAHHRDAGQQHGVGWGLRADRAV